MLETESVRLDAIYVPVKLKKTLDAAKVDALAESILEKGQEVPIQIRRDKERYVLVTGLHRLEACKWLGETTISGYLVQARRH